MYIKSLFIRFHLVVMPLSEKIQFRKAKVGFRNCFLKIFSSTSALCQTDGEGGVVIVFISSVFLHPFPSSLRTWSFLSGLGLAFSLRSNPLSLLSLVSAGLWESSNYKGSEFVWNTQISMLKDTPWKAHNILGVEMEWNLTLGPIFQQLFVPVTPLTSDSRPRTWAGDWWDVEGFGCSLEGLLLPLCFVWAKCWEDEGWCAVDYTMHMPRHICGGRYCIGMCHLGTSWIESKSSVSYRGGPDLCLVDVWCLYWPL